MREQCCRPNTEQLRGGGYGCGSAAWSAEERLPAPEFLGQPSLLRYVHRGTPGDRVDQPAPPRAAAAAKVILCRQSYGLQTWNRSWMLLHDQALGQGGVHSLALPVGDHAGAGRNRVRRG